MVQIHEIKQVLRAMPEGVLLSPYGNEMSPQSLVSPTLGREDVDQLAELFDLKRINEAITEIPKCFVQQRAMSRVSSYALKHHLEHATDSYISNGDFIVAMVLSGYKCTWPKTRGIAVNPILNAKMVAVTR